MALTQYTADTDIIETLGTNPEDRPTLTDDTFKAKFDENAANIKAFLNAMIAELASTANGKGASQIGIEDSAGRYTATQIEAALAEIAGSGRTTETVKGLADLISTHTGDLITDSNGAHGLKIESGTWTPILAGATTEGTNTYARQNGYYNKIGSLVTCQCDIRLSAKDAAMAGALEIRGLPFTTKNQTNRYVYAVVAFFNFTLGTAVGMAAYAAPNTAYLTLAALGNNTAYAGFTAAAVANNTEITITITYEV